jgi:hypothetical protein
MGRLYGWVEGGVESEMEEAAVVGEEKPVLGLALGKAAPAAGESSLFPYLSFSALH